MAYDSQELNDLSAIQARLAQLAANPQSFDQQEYERLIDGSLVALKKISQGLEEFNNLNGQLYGKSSEMSELQNSIKRQQDLTKFLQKAEQQKFFDQALTPFIKQYNDLVAEFEPKFKDDANLKANLDGIAMIDRAFQNHLKQQGFVYVDQQEVEVEVEVEAEVEAVEEQSSAEAAQEPVQEPTEQEPTEQEQTESETQQDNSTKAE